MDKIKTRILAKYKEKYPDIPEDFEITLPNNFYDSFWNTTIPIALPTSIKNSPNDLYSIFTEQEYIKVNLKHTEYYARMMSPLGKALNSKEQ